MEHHGLPPELEDVMTGSVLITNENGEVIGERIYLRGDRHEASAVGLHVRLLSEDQTLNRNRETVVDMMDTHGQPSNYFIG